ncbi:Transaldolase family protein [Candidatus Megaera venefica]|uniref:Transaldolase family protein n=1 Tax=Candidatus Megaera venefica TaxID=2055910 RepID=A0ABU5NCW2_9RICK|nr:fructose-6-phosphate aldolase [Candidatus Megaera venefica]MBY0533938.1 fructose-6-phosphate aldolase [Rickettsiaceae bacterium]MEA0970987.1 Transaldolase family protein [Candidatus Megaera venefica]
MEIFLDSVDLTEIKKYHMYNIVDGITTNPSLMSNSKMDFYETINSICKIVKGDVSVEVASNDFEEMVKEGNKILEVAPNIVVKLPMTWDGLKACKYFRDGGNKVNMTLCFSPNQALLAAKNGATYISPFIGRLEDIGEDGMQLIADIRNIYNNYDFKTKILAASIRTTEHVFEAALCGADVVTIPAKILSQLVEHDLTSKGLEKFNQDWEKSGMKI